MLFYVESEKASAKFAGDESHLVEQLIEACKRKEFVGELKQRDLQPYIFEDLDTAFAPKKPAPQGKSPAKAFKKAVSGSSSSSSSSGASPTRSPTATPERMPAANNRTNKAPANRANNGVPLKMQSGHASAFNMAAKTPGSPTAACPGFFSSPKPEAIPMPTSSFLNRAASGKA